MAVLMLSNIRVKDGLLNDERYKYLFTVEQVNDLVNKGVPFRDAYKQVGNDVANGSFEYSGAVQHTHEGSIGNLCTAEIWSEMGAVLTRFS